MGIQGIVLEDHRNVPVGRGECVDEDIVESDLPRTDRLQAGDTVECGGLAAARRPEQGKKLTILDVQREVPNGVHILEHFADMR